MNAEMSNKIWALREAAKPPGFSPNAASVAEFAKSLEYAGWLHQSERLPVWNITPNGRVELARLEDILEREAADLWRVENPAKNVFACDHDEQETYRQRVLRAAHI